MRVAYSAWLLTGLLVASAVTLADAAPTRRRKSSTINRSNAPESPRNSGPPTRSKSQRPARAASSLPPTERMTPPALAAATTAPSDGNNLNGTFAPMLNVPLTFGSTEQTPSTTESEASISSSSAKNEEKSLPKAAAVDTDTPPTDPSSALGDTTVVEATIPTNAATTTFQPKDQATSAVNGVGSELSDPNPEGTWDKWSRRLANVNWHQVANIVGNGANLFNNVRSNGRPGIKA
ncbi:hypothetical protein H4R34_001857 [Dimargaris verticillata]|uniref:Uncharacterized protein n=1 Tax=Dimargaris verticillata TaxID=2761393 RepID=A0A9W8B942_9FUNG|nr:hypothetical protein H4R34_001857 [Dimargaris verticillata]